MGSFRRKRSDGNGKGDVGSQSRQAQARRSLALAARCKCRSLAKDGRGASQNARKPRRAEEAVHWRVDEKDERRGANLVAARLRQDIIGESIAQMFYSVKS